MGAIFFLVELLRVPEELVRDNVVGGGFFLAHPLMTVILKSFPANSNIWMVDGFTSTVLIFYLLFLVTFLLSLCMYHFNIVIRYFK